MQHTKCFGSPLYDDMHASAPAYGGSIPHAAVGTYSTSEKRQTEEEGGWARPQGS
jgi:hypothetical protein